MILDNLLVQQKLNVLVALPMTMIALLTVPIMAQQVQNAREAGAAATQISEARQVGALIEELDTERALSEAYLASSAAQPVALVSQDSVVDDQIYRTQQAATPSGLESALASLQALGPLREQVLQRTADPLAVEDGYTEYISTLIEALDLAADAAPSDAMADDLAALDALLRTDAASGVVGAALLAAEADPADGAVARAQAVSAVAGYLNQADDVPAAGQAADQAAHDATVSRLLAAVESQDGLRRLVQDDIVHDLVTVTADAAGRARLIAVLFGLFALLLMGSVTVLTIRVGRSISGPLRKLTSAAVHVATIAQQELIRVADEDLPEDQAVPKLAAVEIVGEDEIGELGAAINRVQATAALLLERQVAGRGNIASMFSSVGRRTQNLVSRQLSLIDDLERGQADPVVLEQLYRLDHLTSRLRRNSNSLVVISGLAERSISAKPMPLAAVLRAALGEIEDYRGVRPGDLADVLISPAAVADLTLLFAELLENAVSSCPPDTSVDVSARAYEGTCRVRIVDHGHGMAPDALARENSRLISRERLDLAPTEVLGLFVVGRISRRHGLEVRLEHTPDGGVTAVVVLPSHVLLDAHPPHHPGETSSRALPGAPERPGPAGARAHAGYRPTAALHRAIEQLPEPTSGPGQQHARTGVGDPRNGLNQRIRGAQLPVTNGEGEPRSGTRSDPAAGPRDHSHADRAPDGRLDPAQARRRITEFAAGEARAMQAAEPVRPRTNGQRVDTRRLSAPQETVDEVEAELCREVRSLSDAGGGFDWLTPPQERHATGTRPRTPSPDSTPPTGAEGLRRRIPGAGLAASAAGPARPEFTDGFLDPESARARIEAFDNGVARAMRAEGETSGKPTGDR